MFKEYEIGSMMNLHDATNFIYSNIAWLRLGARAEYWLFSMFF